MGVGSVDYSTFSYPRISDVILPNELEDIGNSAFYVCVNLSEVTLPKKIKTIESYAFAMTGLSEITIPTSVRYISSDAFDECEFTSVIYEGSEKHWKNFLANNSLVVGDVNKEGDPFIDFDMTYLCGTYTTVSTDGKTFTIAVDEKYSGKTLILALYNGDVLVDAKSIVYSGDDLIFNTNESYDGAKVMVWSNLDTIEPVTGVEILNLK